MSNFVEQSGPVKISESVELPRNIVELPSNEMETLESESPLDITGTKQELYNGQLETSHYHQSEIEQPMNIPGRKPESSSGYSSSSPPTPTSPMSISPPHTLKRSKSSSFRLIDRRTSITSQISVTQEPENGYLSQLIGWYPMFLLRIFLNLSFMLLHILVAKLPFAIPTLWLSAYLWLFWKVIQLPLSIMKTILIYLFVPSSERYRNKSRTVLISGGSSVQAIHLARNFYSAGARVVVCETEGHFGLARFSTAVHKYYVVPQPSDDYPELYVDALKKIVLEEKVNYYIPVSAASAVYYDALAKPHIESLGCECICPDVKEVFILDDNLEFMRRIHNEGMTTPNHYLIQSRSDLARLYDSGVLQNGSHIMVNVGPASCKKKHKIELPATRKRLKLTEPISEQQPWLVIQDSPGQHFITCTTVKGSKVVANVTCRLDTCGHGLVPVEHNEIELWIRQFFASLKSHTNISGHMSFIFAEASDKSGSILPLQCQVGVKFPYMCYTSVHPRVVWKPCRHFSRATSGPIVTDGGRYWLNETFFKTVTQPSMEAITRSAGMIFDRREALFVLWDPLPYCAFYYLQLPLNSLSKALQRPFGNS